MYVVTTCTTCLYIYPNVHAICIHSNYNLRSMNKKKHVNICPSIGSHDLAYEIITFGGKKNQNLGIIYVLQKSFFQKKYQIEHLIKLNEKLTTLVYYYKS
jgi:hypothetical protein